MPSLSPTMTIGNVASWQKKEGDKVRAIAPFEHSTCRAVSYVPWGGTLLQSLQPTTQPEGGEGRWKSRPRCEPSGAVGVRRSWRATS
jgi:hypothetical protein